MPLIKSAKKQNRQNKRNHARNQHFKALFTESRKAFETAVKDNNVEAANAAFFNTKKDGKTTRSGLISNIDKLAKKNIIHPNNADRKKSKYAAILKTLATSNS